MRIWKWKIKRSQIMKFVWIMVSAFVALMMVVSFAFPGGFAQ